MPTKTATNQAKCNECGGTIKLLKNAETNEIIQCLECGTEYEILTLNPIKLGPAPKEEEDWGE